MIQTQTFVFTLTKLDLKIVELFSAPILLVCMSIRLNLSDDWFFVSLLFLTLMVFGRVQNKFVWLIKRLTFILLVNDQFVGVALMHFKNVGHAGFLHNICVVNRFSNDQT